MKKAILFLTAMILLGSVTKAQTKTDYKDMAKKAAYVTDKEFGFVNNKDNNKLIAKLPAGSDTLELTKDCKFIKVNGRTIDVSLINNAVLILSEKDLESFFTGIQEYPAKIANPFTQYFLKFFGLTIQEPKK